MPSLAVIGPQIKEKQRGAQSALLPAYMVPKDPSLNRVNVHYTKLRVFDKRKAVIILCFREKSVKFR